MKEIEKTLKHPALLKLNSVLGKKADLHLVGGAVRDLCEGKSPKDLDLATSLHPEKVLEELEAAGMRVIPVGIRRGTVAAISEGEVIEITTFRNPQKENIFTKSIQEDLPARDFTINAIAVSLNSGEVVDPFNGRKDLEEGILRTVGDPKLRFTEDPHRIFRMIRFGVGSGRSVDPATEAAATELVNLMKGEAVERLTAELCKVLVMPRAAACIREMERLGILAIVLPEILPCVGLEQNHHHKLDVFEHTLAVVDNSDPLNLKVRLAALFHDIGKPDAAKEIDGVTRMLGHEDISEEITRAAMTRLKFSNHMIDDVCLLVKLHMKPFKTMKGGGIRRLIKATGPLLDDWLELKRADTLGARNLDYDFEVEWDKFLTKVDKELNRPDVPKVEDGLAIGGKEIMALGVPQGPLVGKVLHILTERVLDTPELNTIESLTSMASELLAEVTDDAS